MLGIHDLGLFVLAGLLLNITPGPDMLYIIGRSTALRLAVRSCESYGAGGNGVGTGMKAGNARRDEGPDRTGGSCPHV